MSNDSAGQNQKNTSGAGQRATDANNTAPVRLEDHTFLDLQTLLTFSLNIFLLLKPGFEFTPVRIGRIRGLILQTIFIRKLDGVFQISKRVGLLNGLVQDYDARVSIQKANTLLEISNIEPRSVADGEKGDKSRRNT